MTGKARAVAGWIGQVVAWVVILGVGAVLVVAVILPRVTGAVPYTVLTGSMRPGMPEGSLVVVRPTDPDTIGVGDVVTYQLESGKPTVVTHRVVEVSSSLVGDRYFTTQGDANDIPDEKTVRSEQIVGVRWYHVPYLGYVNNLITGDQRQIVLVVVVTGLLGYAAYMFVGGWRDRRKGKGAADASPAAGIADRVAEDAEARVAEDPDAERVGSVSAHHRTPQTPPPTRRQRRAESTTE